MPAAKGSARTSLGPTITFIPFSTKHMPVSILATEIMKIMKFSGLEILWLWKVELITGKGAIGTELTGN